MMLASVLHHEHQGDAGIELIYSSVMSIAFPGPTNQVVKFLNTRIRIF